MPTKSVFAALSVSRILYPPLLPLRCPNRYDFSRRGADAKSLLDGAVWRLDWPGWACVVPDSLSVEAQS